MKEKVILNRMKAGDEEAFAWLYNHYWQKVYHFARLYLTSSSEISEAVQDVFLHVWEARETFDNSKNFDGYLFIITRNIIFNYSRRYFNELNFKMTVLQSMEEGYSIGEFYQFNLSSCIRQQNSLTAQFVSFSLANLANIFYPPRFLQ